MNLPDRRRSATPVWTLPTSYNRRKVHRLKNEVADLALTANR